MDNRLDVSRLESLLESSKLLNSSLELKEMLRHLLRTVMGRLLASRAAISLTGYGTALTRGLPGLREGDPFDAERAAALGLNLVFPIGPAEEPLGLLALHRPLKAALDEDEQEFIGALLALAAGSIRNARAHEDVVSTNRTLDQKVQELRALIDLGRGLAATTDPEEAAQLLMLTLAGRWVARKHAIVTWKLDQPVIERLRGIELPGAPTLRPVISAIAEPALLESALPEEIRTLLALPPGSAVFPLRSGDAVMGLVVCGPRLGNIGYTETDLEFGSGLVAQAAIALDNAWHFRDTVARKQIEKELALAASIQQDLFPKSLPPLASTELAARNRPARECGGDYYDVLPMPAAACAQSFLLTVVDISGKGIGAALLMSNIQATLRTLLASEGDLSLLAARTNDLLHASTPPNKYATAFFLGYDPSTGVCEYVNGGHADGIVVRAGGGVELLGTTGLPVGLFPRRDFDRAAFVLNPGDLLLLYSDGVTDAVNMSDEEFGLDRLTATVSEAAGRPCAEILDVVIRAVDAHAGQAPQFDDITLLAVKRLES